SAPPVAAAAAKDVVAAPSPAAESVQSRPAEAARSQAPAAGRSRSAEPARSQRAEAAPSSPAEASDTAPTLWSTVSADISADPLLAALLKGAGVPQLAIPGGLSPELMRTIGGMVRESLRGILDLLQARAMTKRKLRADATVIVAQDNNPLKFSPTVEAVMSHMLVPLGSGFMPPVRALADAHQSLQSHQLGFKAGMHAGLGSVLKRLDPHALEERTARPSLIGSLVPSAHRARLWDAYTELHANVTRDAENDFHSLFEREFLSAYHFEVSRSRSGDAH